MTKNEKMAVVKTVVVITVAVAAQVAARKAIGNIWNKALTQEATPTSAN